MDLLSAFPAVFSDIPGCTSLIEHDIALTSGGCLKPKVYLISVHLQQHFRREVDQLLEQGKNQTPVFTLFLDRNGENGEL